MVSNDHELRQTESMSFIYACCELIVIAHQLLHLLIRWCQIGVEPSASSTELSTNNNMADNPEVTSEE